MPPSAVPASSGRTPENVRTQLNRILASGIFGNSQRLTKFPQFVVEHSVAHRGGEVKEYAIGVEGFERGANFDPRIDPIVRVQAAKLRSKLTEYYSAQGRDDTLIISIPKGGYAAVFSSPTAPPRTIAQPGSNDLLLWITLVSGLLLIAGQLY